MVPSHLNLRPWAQEFNVQDFFVLVPFGLPELSKKLI